jgi:hypothetical protein
MTDLRVTGQSAEVLHQASNPPLRATQLVAEALVQATNPPLRVTHQTVEALVSLTAGGVTRRRTVVVVAC